MLVIAHPDDETMFFSPTIHELRRRGCNVTILCLSNGEGSSGDVHSQLALLDSVRKAVQATTTAWVV